MLFKFAHFDLASKKHATQRLNGKCGECARKRADVCLLAIVHSSLRTLLLPPRVRTGVTHAEANDFLQRFGKVLVNLAPFDLASGKSKQLNGIVHTSCSCSFSPLRRVLLLRVLVPPSHPPPFTTAPNRTPVCFFWPSSATS
jgi:hypothetical protein